MTPIDDLCTRAEYITAHLTPLPLNTPIPCSICLSSYTPTNPPVSLLECAHTFCLPCILTWFHSDQENAHTCPLDRADLFLPNIFNDPTRTVVETARGYEIIAVRGRLTREGCRHIIRDLWIATKELGSSVDEGVLRAVVRGVFPRGVAGVVEVAGEAGLMRIAWQMMEWHAEGGEWADAWQGPRWAPSDELSGFVEAFHEACGTDEEEE